MPNTFTESADASVPAVEPLDPAAGSGTRTPLSFELHYQALSELARGGQGRVLLARDSVLHREVALKEVLRPERDGALRRFEREALLTARLQHPAIVSIYELARRSSGEPVLVMRRVQGKPFDRAIDEAGSYEKRLALLGPFIAACDAIAYAHQQGVVHRDIKPSNVLLGDFGDTVVIDWGIAKELGDPAEETPVVAGEEVGLTGAGAMLGTPAFMSPEQARGEPADAQSDVYALGAMLYQLISGRPAYRGDTALQVLEAVRRGAPAPVSSLIPGLPAELITMVGRAMAPHRKDRYLTARELSEELKRFQTGQLVRSHRYSTWELVRRWAQRNAALLTASGIFFVLLAAGGVVSVRRILAERERANREAAASKRVSEFMTSMFKVSDPGEARGNSVTAREILDKAAGEIDTGLAQDPVLRAQMMATMGTVYSSLGLYAKARPLVTGALALRNQLLGPAAPETLESMRMLGTQFVFESRYAEAEKQLTETVALDRRILGRDHSETVLSMLSLSAAIAGAGRPSDAEKMDREALEVARRVFGPEHPTTIRALNSLAGDAYDLGHREEAEGVYRELLEILNRTAGPGAPITLQVLGNLGACLTMRQKYAEAEAVLRDLLGRHRKVMGPEHSLTLGVLNNLGFVLRRSGRLQEAEAVLRETLALRERTLGPEHSETLGTMMDLGVTMMKAHRYPEANEMLQHALDVRVRVFGPRHPLTAEARYGLANNSALSGHPDEALAYLRAALDGLPAWELAQIDQDSDFAPLHGDPRFDALVAEAKKRAAK